MMTDIDQRMFYLMLSATEGQQFANTMGFSIPSEDVQELEIMDVIARWFMVANVGVFDEIREASHWFVDFLEASEKLNSPSEDFINALTVYSVALINKLMDNGYVGLIVDKDDLEELENE